MGVMFKCKMCGGDVQAEKGSAVGKCMYCGSTMTVPQIDDDRKARMFNRANEYRLNAEFDKAYEAYEAIAKEDETESEAYWGMILSEYGIEYVEDPATNKRVPTCHRTKVQSIQSSVNFKNAIQYADAESRMLYQDEAEELDALQRNILAKSAEEQPYDVFICYKESDDFTEERTQDSVIAQEIYQALTDKGIRTFFARVSLQNHIGENYEPYIFAALTSAKVMVHVTTSAEHSNAAWVKNEWSRYLQLIQENREKTLIPVYRDMSAYQLPEQMANLQAQDISKVGAMQDLVAGISRLLGKATTETGNKAINELVADKLEREEKSRKTKRLVRRIVIAASAAAAVAIIVFCIYKFVYYPEKYVREPRYNNAVEAMNSGEYASALTGFKELGENYKDCKSLMFECRLGLIQTVDPEYESYGEDLENYVQDFIEAYEWDDLSDGEKAEFEEVFSNALVSAEDDNTAESLITTVSGAYGNEGNWQSVYEWAKVDNDIDNENYTEAIVKAVELRDNEDANSNENFDPAISKIESAADTFADTYKSSGTDDSAKQALNIYDTLAEYDLNDSENKLDSICQEVYTDAQSEMDEGNYEKAETKYELLEKYSYEDSEEKLKAAKYARANELFSGGEYVSALRIFTTISDYEDAGDKGLECKYLYCKACETAPDDTAYGYIEDLVTANYKDSTTLQASMYQWRAEITLGVGASYGTAFKAIDTIVSLTGGPPNGSTKVTFEALINGETLRYTSEESVSAGGSTSANINYSNTTLDIFNMPLTVNIYDESGNLIGTKSVDHVE